MAPNFTFLLLRLALGLGLVASGLVVNAQHGKSFKDIDSHSPVTQVDVITEINFGTFYPGDIGGTIEIDPRGFRTASGSAVLLPMGDIPNPIIMEIVARPSTMIQVILPREIILYGAQGGQITFIPGPLEFGSVFVTPPNADRGFTVNMGGTLEVGTVNENPPGNYFGAFSFTIVSE